MSTEEQSKTDEGQSRLTVGLENIGLVGADHSGTWDGPRYGHERSYYCATVLERSAGIRKRSGGRASNPMCPHRPDQCSLTFEFTGLRGFLRRSGGMMGSASCQSRLLKGQRNVERRNQLQPRRQRTQADNL